MREFWDNVIVTCYVFAAYFIGVGFIAACFMLGGLI